MSNHFNRRTVMGGTAGLASAIASISNADAKLPKNDVEPRGKTGKLERLPTLDLEANDEFLTSFRIWVNSDLNRAATQRAEAIMKADGLDKAFDMPLAEAFKHRFNDDPVVQMRAHVWLHAQNLMWHNLKREFHGNYDAYMAEMEAADNAGPGKLEMNPGIEPAYTKHEIHIQPGGYVGDPFAGHLYHYGTNNFYSGRNYQDDLHVAMAANVPTPKDGKVLRILDQGCSCGQLTVALKQRFPDAEVWGIDVGGPMVRYSHMRAVDMGVGANFRQALAEDSKFPDGHFDIVTSYILHHEVTAEVTRKITEESHRVLRAGGVYYPIDFRTGTGGRSLQREMNPYEKTRNYASHRWNHERWLMQYNTISHADEMKRAGFEVNENGPASGFGGRGANVMGTKKA
ncbi:MAG: class I SAM-dependent methyltransferase [Alphaproteobacteria bacterium]|nr:class I SAM-dependent methyltransferase [Alphaproteobacteria bacterium]